MNFDLNRLTVLKQEWESLQPLLPERHATLWRKLRLEWNYHSNHIEGNTLTYEETELLLLHDRTIGNHHHREYLEMKAHDVGIGHVAALAADPARIIAEADIRNLNKIILKEPFWKAAETRDGQATRKEIIPGQYKTSPNNVRLANGEIFFFASVEDTPPKMQALAVWNWQGTLNTSGGNNQLSFDSQGLPAGQIANIEFFSNNGVTSLGQGVFMGNELVPVPEPGALFSVAALFGAIGFRGRRAAVRSRVRVEG